MKALLWLWTLSLLIPFGFGQQENAAERLFFNAQTFLAAGKYQEALTDLENVTKLHPRSPFASQALLEIGRYHLEVAGDDGKAQEYFGKTLAQYPTSPEAPAAYYYQAVIVDKNGDSPQALEGAIANLIRMENLFPNNPWRSGALYLFGKISMRLGQYDQALTHFQRLEFNYPQSEFLPNALFLSAKVAYYKGFPDKAERILARRQAKFPNSKDGQLVRDLLRVLSRMRAPSIGYTLDRSFFASTPKTFQNPSALGISWNGRMGVRDSRGVFQADLDGDNKARTPVKDARNFCTDAAGNLLVVFENRISNTNASISFGNLAGGSGPLREIRGAAIDGYGRLFVIDNNTRDVRSFLANGKPLRNFAISKPKQIAAFEERIWVLNSDGNSFTEIGPNLETDTFSLKAVSNIQDFCFDALGHVYVLHDKGSQLSVFDKELVAKTTIGLKTGTWPLKKAEAVAVDASGALYLADKKTGAVFRFN